MLIIKHLRLNMILCQIIVFYKQPNLVYSYFLCCVTYTFVFDFIGMLLFFLLVLCFCDLAHELSTCVYVHLLCLTCLVAKGFQHIKIICTTVQV